VSTPVEEVGRDHDFDWAVVEPSSFRSIIQLAGRVLRHQQLAKHIQKPNIALLQTNLKGLMGEKIAYCRPGYESHELTLATKDLGQLVDQKKLAKRLDASFRIQRADVLDFCHKLADLEHEAIHRLLTAYENMEAGALQDWLSGNWWMTGMPQKLVRFRLDWAICQQNLYLVPVDGQLVFCEKDAHGQPVPVEKIYGIEHIEALTQAQVGRLWLKRDYLALLEEVGEGAVEQAALVYGEINLVRYSDNEKYRYSNYQGLQRC
jgi:CRISPR-associated endonuclease/helicase Cas3